MLLPFKNLLEKFIMITYSKKWIFVSILGIIVIASLIRYATKERKEEPIIYVEVTHPLQKEMIESISTTGTITAEKETTLASKISGKIKSIHVSEGDQLTSGQLVIQLESKELKLQKEIAQSAHRSAASQVDEENYKRHKALYEEGVITKAEFDKIESEYKAATSEKERLEKTVELQEEQQASSDLTAPFDALTAKIFVHEGEVIAAGQPLALLVNMDSVYAEVSIASHNIEKIKKDMEAHLMVDSSSNTFKGMVDTLSPVADPLSRTFDAKIKIHNENHILKPGMFAKVSVITDRKPQAITLPKTALVKKEGLAGKWIYTVENNKAHLREIKIGLESAQDIEVISPLDTQSIVVTAGQSELFDNATVSVVTPPPHGNH